MESDQSVEGGTCSVCIHFVEDLVKFSGCGHSFCKSCIQIHFETVLKGTRNKVTCLQCSTEVTQSEVRTFLHPALYEKYLEHSLRRYLVLQPNVRHCIAPDCSFVYILDLPSSCSDNHFVCRREGCGVEFCYQCKNTWHEGISCDEAKNQHQQNGVEKLGPKETLTKEQMKSLNIKCCPRCGTVAEKVDDGSCNHVHCNVCDLEFCWLCLRPSSELHFLSPTGCPMYGHQRWSWWKRWSCRLSLWFGAPLLLMLISFIVFIVCIFAIPILTGYLVFTADSLRRRSRCCQLTSTIIAVSVSSLLSPLVSLLLALIVIPIGLFYVYIFVPIHLLRTYTRRIPDQGGRIPIV